MQKTYVLLTRPRQDSESLAAHLQARGKACRIEPMLAIRQYGDVALALEQVQAFLLTSANGARALADTTAERHLPAYVVGDKTAAAACDLGFENVHSADGDIHALASLVIAAVDPKAGVLLHATGEAIAGDLAGVLVDYGFDVRRVALYQALPTEKISTATADALRNGEITDVLFFSPRTAAAFVRLVNDAGLTCECAQVSAICLSPAVAGAAEGLPWKTLRVAAHPDEAALLRELGLE
ncbi:MAG: uroporphyrinogen-III synthase [Rhodospirillaceae bacterium]|nr:MAG: uroporphyrinogen-III synthase [Rhodospirillaceae bacterium]